MSIKVGERIPEATLNILKDGVQAIESSEFFADRRVLLFAVPGAFTPTCSAKHLPGYVDAMDEFRRREITVACLAVNDAFVMGAWGKSQDAPEDLVMLADGNGTFTRALGLELDATGFGMGLRSQRFAMYVDNGVVRKLQVEAPGEFKVSSAEAMLKAIS
ncbi:MAG: peroxiredoxin [Rhodanobacteraceae bacterium]|nr:peroxiredoxin [Xanthomonadales bacterium]MCP5478939.1 peroxiredoxin [Rhodanobacteraceae bacterium]HPF73508.1 peroxiredoxin [Xanthomonadaceae bacterium]HRY00047.1 peroxiredoxin [Xanthomonadaceae bacterium]